MLSRSVMSDTLQLHGLQPTGTLCPRGFSRQEYWRGLLFPPPGGLPDLGIEPRSTTLQADSLAAELPGDGDLIPPLYLGERQANTYRGTVASWDLLDPTCTFSPGHTQPLTSASSQPK